MPVKVRFTLRAEPSHRDPKSTVPHLIAIQFIDDDTIYAFPDKFKELSHHGVLMALPVADSARKDLAPRWQRRTFKITLPDDVAKLYMDDEGNPVFSSTMLSEYAESSSSFADLPPTASVQVSANVDPKPKSVSSLVKDAVLSKFNAKNHSNPEVWLDLFESECVRLGLQRTQFWEVIRLFLEDSAEKWYHTIRQTSKSTSWDFWRESFLENFSQNSLSVARHAYSYRFNSGSLSDYFQTKHNLLVSLNPQMHEKDKILHIVLGLPNYLQNRIDLHEVSNVGRLSSVLNSFSVTPSRSSSSFSQNRNSSNSNSSSVFSSLRPRTPCPYCRSKGFERFHFEKDCFTKFRDNRSKNTKSTNNAPKAINSFDVSELENEISELQKNE